MNREAAAFISPARKRRESGILDDAGPAFGQASLAALSLPAGPLHGRRITFRHIHYDWKHAEQLIDLLSEGQRDNPITICSSEGASSSTVPTPKSNRTSRLCTHSK
jgi:hypothetical protein